MSANRLKPQLLQAIGTEEIIAECECAGGFANPGYDYLWLSEDSLFLSQLEYRWRFLFLGLKEFHHILRIPLSLFSRVELEQGVTRATLVLQLWWRKDAAAIEAEAETMRHSFPVGRGGFLKLSLDGQRVVSSNEVFNKLKTLIDGEHSFAETARVRLVVPQTAT